MNHRRSLLFAVIGLAGLFVGSTSLLASSVIERARTLMQSNAGLPEASRLLKVTLSDPTLSTHEKESGRLLLAECVYRQKAPQEALSLLNQLSRTASSPALRESALFRLAMLQMDQGLERQGQASYERITKEFPESSLAPSALMIQGNYALLIKGDQSKAVAFYTEVAKRYPDSKEGEIARTALPGIKKLSVPEIKAASLTYKNELKKIKMQQSKINEKPSSP